MGSKTKKAKAVAPKAATLAEIKEWPLTTAQGIANRVAKYLEKLTRNRRVPPKCRIGLTPDCDIQVDPFVGSFPFNNDPEIEGMLSVIESKFDLTIGDKWVCFFDPFDYKTITPPDGIDNAISVEGPVVVAVAKVYDTSKGHYIVKITTYFEIS